MKWKIHPLEEEAWSLIMARYWTGEIGPKDDFGYPIDNEFIDGATLQGPWAIMAPSTWKVQGRGLGPGRGQRYEKQENGRWLKVEG